MEKQLLDKTNKEGLVGEEILMSEYKIQSLLKCEYYFRNDENVEKVEIISNNKIIVSFQQNPKIEYHFIQNNEEPELFELKRIKKITQKKVINEYFINNEESIENLPHYVKAEYNLDDLEDSKNLDYWYEQKSRINKAKKNFFEYVVKEYKNFLLLSYSEFEDIYKNYINNFADSDLLFVYTGFKDVLYEVFMDYAETESKTETEEYKENKKNQFIERAKELGIEANYHGLTINIDADYLDLKKEYEEYFKLDSGQTSHLLKVELDNAWQNGFNESEYVMTLPIATNLEQITEIIDNILREFISRVASFEHSKTYIRTIDKSLAKDWLIKHNIYSEDKDELNENLKKYLSNRQSKVRTPILKQRKEEFAQANKEIKQEKADYVVSQTMELPNLLEKQAIEDNKIKEQMEKTIKSEYRMYSLWECKYFFDNDKNVKKTEIESNNRIIVTFKKDDKKKYVFFQNNNEPTLFHLKEIYHEENTVLTTLERFVNNDENRKKLPDYVFSGYNFELLYDSENLKNWDSYKNKIKQSEKYFFDYIVKEHQDFLLKIENNISNISNLFNLFDEFVELYEDYLYSNLDDDSYIINKYNQFKNVLFEKLIDYVQNKIESKQDTKEIEQEKDNYVVSQTIELPNLLEKQAIEDNKNEEVVQEISDNKKSYKEYQNEAFNVLEPIDEIDYIGSLKIGTRIDVPKITDFDKYICKMFNIGNGKVADAVIQLKNSNFEDTPRNRELLSVANLLPINHIKNNIFLTWKKEGEGRNWQISLYYNKNLAEIVLKDEKYIKQLISNISDARCSLLFDIILLDKGNIVNGNFVLSSKENIIKRETLGSLWWLLKGKQLDNLLGASIDSFPLVKDIVQQANAISSDKENEITYTSPCLIIKRITTNPSIAIITTIDTIDNKVHGITAITINEENIDKDVLICQKFSMDFSQLQDYIVDLDFEGTVKNALFYYLQKNTPSWVTKEMDLGVKSYFRSKIKKVGNPISANKEIEEVIEEVANEIPDNDYKSPLKFHKKNTDIFEVEAINTEYFKKSYNKKDYKNDYILNRAIEESIMLLFFDYINSLKLTANDEMLKVAEQLSKSDIFDEIVLSFVKKSLKNPTTFTRFCEHINKLHTEKEILTNFKDFVMSYVGYGGLAKQSDDKLTGKDVGLLNEYYTDDYIVKKMWQLVGKFGFKGGNVLEPSVATGRFLAYANENTTNCVGYEINMFSATICKILYPTIDLTIKPFEEHFYTESNYRNNFDLVIGNPPYGTFGSLRKLSEEKRLNVKIKQFEHYFILSAFDCLKSGGLLCYVVPSNLFNTTIKENNMYDNIVAKIQEKADLLDAYLLPNTAFGTKTKVNTCIMVLRKK